MAAPNFSHCCSGVLVKREERILGRSDGAYSENTPILVATHCSHLDNVLRQTAPDMWKNLVFMQNGMLQPWLRKNGLQENTQMLLYMSSSPENVQNPKSRMKIVTGDKETLVWGRQFLQLICTFPCAILKGKLNVPCLPIVSLVQDGTKNS